MSGIIAVGIPSIFGLAGGKPVYQDEGILLGDASVINVVGNAAVATLASGVLTLTVNINEHYKGVYANLSALQAAHATSNLGDYALVDAGSGSDALAYYWDAQDGWVTNGSTVSLTDTDALAEGLANLYFTNGRAITAGATAFARYDQAQSLTNSQKSQLLTNIGAKKSANLLNKTDSYSLQLSDFKTDVDLYDTVYLRMDSATNTNITVDTTLSTLPLLTQIHIRNVGAGMPTLVSAGTDLNGNLVFTAVDEVKTLIKVGTNEYDVIGVLS